MEGLPLYETGGGTVEESTYPGTLSTPCEDRTRTPGALPVLPPVSIDAGAMLRR
jgi:hypothetical protein